MKKNKVSSDLFLLLLTGIFVIISLELLAAKCEWPKIIQNIIGIITIVATVVWAISFIAFIIVDTRNLFRLINRRKDIAKRELSLEAKKVILINHNIFQEKDFECEVKVGEDGKIHVNVHLDKNMKFDDQNDFLEYFYFPDDE